MRERAAAGHAAEPIGRGTNATPRCTSTSNLNLAEEAYGTVTLTDVVTDTAVLTSVAEIE